MQEIKKVWAKSGNVFQLINASEQVEKLKPGIYDLQSDPWGMPILVQIADKFEFPYKVYGIEERFINIVKKTYQNTTGNLGILLNGIQI